MNKILTAWERTELWPAVAGGDSVSDVILVSCITRHLTILLLSTLALNVGHNSVFTIHILRPGARAKSLWAWENFPGTRLLSRLDIEILFMGRKYILITANIYCGGDKAEEGSTVQMRDLDRWVNILKIINLIYVSEVSSSWSYHG